MIDTADTNLVLALLAPEDALHKRARVHVSREGRLTVPLSVSIEILLGAHKRKTPLTPLVMMIDELFDIESLDRVLVAARALDEGRVQGVFDAVHAADAHLRGARLHTADDRLLRSGFPTTPF